VDGAIAYDASRRIFLFGGQDSSPRNDLWAYSLERRQWTEVQAGGSRPPARFGHTMILDPQRRRLVVFGGQGSGFFSDTWAYDIERGSWRQLSPDPAGPVPRYGHSAIYDGARDRMIVSHGFTSAGRFDDTWAFSLSSNTWREISPPSNRPLRRCLHDAAYDPAGNQMLLYGGCASGFGPCPLGDLWSFDLNNHRWTERTGSARPPARQWSGLQYDGRRGRLLLFGGSGGGGLLADTWKYDPAADAWTESPLQASAPPGRERHEAAYAADLGATFFFGGRTGSGPTNELWMLAASAGSGPPEGVAAAFDSRGELAGARDAEPAVRVGGASAVVERIPVTPAKPGLFPGAFHPDGFRNTPENPAASGSVVVLFATGQGATSPASRTGAYPVDIFPAPVAAVTLRISARPAELLFRGQAPGTAVMPINARVPEGITPGSAAPVVLENGDARNQDGVPISIR
jgi:hypothetical protein